MTWSTNNSPRLATSSGFYGEVITTIWEPQSSFFSLVTSMRPLVHFLTRLMNGYIRAIFCLSLFCRRCSVSALIFQLLSRYTFLSSYPTRILWLHLEKLSKVFSWSLGLKLRYPHFTTLWGRSREGGGLFNQTFPQEIHLFLPSTKLFFECRKEGRWYRKTP